MVKSASRVNSRRDARHAANYFALLAAMPFRRPEWRFELAQQIVAENLGRAWTAIDPTVAVAVDHLRAGDGMSKLLAPADRRRLRDLSTRTGDLPGEWTDPLDFGGSGAGPTIGRADRAALPFAACRRPVVRASVLRRAASARCPRCDSGAGDAENDPRGDR